MEFVLSSTAVTNLKRNMYVFVSERKIIITPDQMGRSRMIAGMTGKISVAKLMYKNCTQK